MYISRKRLLIMSITILMMILLSNIFGIVSNRQIESAITTARVNLRKNTTLDTSSVIKTLNEKENLRIINELDNFYIVQLPTNEFGLVSKDYVSLQNTDTSAFPKFEPLETFTTTIKNESTNIRTGPGTNFAVVTTLAPSTNVQVIGKSDKWYLVVSPNNFVGLVRDDLINITPTGDSNQNNNLGTLPNTVQTVLNLINETRKNQGLSELIIDDLLNSTAQTKAKDMVANNYFAHESPTYGSPFQMMQDAGITYKTAGENIAGNQSVESAVNSWIASETHRQNILSNAYNYIGIGLEKSNTYGYVIVVMFIGK